MNKDKLRVAIAVACGMVWCRIGTDEKPYRMLCWCNPACTSADMTEPICNPAYMWEHGDVPDYPNDLNAMHEAEMTLDTTGRWIEYVKELGRIFQRDINGKGTWELYCEATHSRGDDALAYGIASFVAATALQRAEAFARVMGIWEDGE